MTTPKISTIYAAMEYQARTKYINQLQKRYPGTKRKRTDHGNDEYRVEFIKIKTGVLVASHDVPHMRGLFNNI